MSLSISVFGLGYVGSVTAACLAHQGYRVVGVDVSRQKVETLGGGRSPIVEAQMQELVSEGCRAGRLTATTDAGAAVRETDISFVAVGTPSLRSGKLDLSHIERVASEIGTALRHKLGGHTVVLRSTMLPGSTEGVAIPALEAASGRRAGPDFSVCYNPEFLREGSAVADFLDPPCTVLGGREPTHLAALREVYRGTPGSMFETGIAVAEMVKYACNAFHAVKVGFANEIGTLCKNLGVDTEAVTRIFTSDTRLNISPAYLAPGYAFGGSCLPKDLRALIHCARERDLKLPLLESILPSNLDHIERSVDAVLATRAKKVAVLGLSFKAGTDDLRESPQVELIKRLIGEGCQVRVWDPHVSLGLIAGSNREYIEGVIPHIGSLVSTDLEQVVREAEVVIIGTKSVDSQQLARCLSPQHRVIDLVNLESSRRPGSAARYEGICW
ncbi:MAG TPA: UDP-glucose/GDP-mannose dehydrogenase family protein [Terriglobia bacterium]|nr:UDP-glucose/GDP-mannose dehydrogenase family protein [Terriglobia bacterium]